MTAPHAAPFRSQHGEDILCWKLFARSRGPRYFVEVGVIDGVRFSNTLALEERGWRGLCVEAHPAYAALAQQNRPRSLVVHAAAGDRNEGAVTFYADPRGDLSSLVHRGDDEMRARFGKWYQGYDAVEVPIRTLDGVLEEAGAPVGLEVLSIDIEGAELPALQGLSLQRWKPRLLILEADDAEARDRLIAHLRPRGYRFARMVGVNAIFTRTLADCWRVRLTRIDTQVFHAKHPLDAEGADSVVTPSAFETRSQFAGRVARSFAKAA